MEISQPTLNKILNTPIEEVVKALVEGKIMDINGGDHMAIKKRYNCKTCGFEWHSSEKDIEMCVDCESGEISMLRVDEEIQKPPVEHVFGRERGEGNGGIGAIPPRVCKCTNCGYETEKIPGVSYLNTKCPECGTKLCGEEYKKNLIKKLGVD